MSRSSGRARSMMGLLAILIVSTACLSGPIATPSQSPIAGPELTPWQSEVLNLEADGTRSLESALTLFAMAFGPVPGVAASAAEAGAIGSASPAVRVIRELRDQLSDEQRAAIDGYLTPSDDSTPLEIPALGSARIASLAGPAGVSGVAASDYDPFERDLVQLGQQARRAAAPYFGDIPDFGGKSGLSVRLINAPEMPFLTFFNPTFGPGGFEKCDVFVNSGHADLGLAKLGGPLTLDVVHCFQSWRMTDDQGFDGNVPAWAWEGPAEYIMLEAWPTQEDDVLYWATYILLPDVPLFERAYDAFGYYAQAREAGVDLGSAFVAVLTDVDDAERFALAGTTSNAFLDKWASELIRSARGDWGPDWTFSTPGNFGESARVPMQAMSVANGSLESFSQDAYSNHIFAMHSAADVVEVDSFGRVRVGDGTIDSVIPGSAVFCTTDKGCGPCPDGSDPPVQPTRLSADSILAVSGGTDGTNGTVSGHALEEYCRETPPPTGTPSPTATPKPDPCTSGCPMSNGDVHLVTIDGGSYDFQAVGEFVLLRTPEGSFEIQGRQEPFGYSSSVSINTAIAMRVGGQRIGVYGNEDVDDSLTILVDGAVVDPRLGPVSVGNATITFVDGRFPAYEVALADGTRLALAGQIRYGINLTVVPSDSMRQGVVGLMGPIPPGSMGVPALPDGSVLPAQVGRDAYQEQLYGVFEEAWRVTADMSLFDYADGRTTASYVDPNFPVRDEVVSFDQLTPDQVAAGEAACGNIGFEFLRQQCIYDVAVTGLDFGDLYDLSAQVVDRGTLARTGQLVRVVNLFWDRVTGAQTLDVYAWSESGAALVTTVGYGEATEFFDPGIRDKQFGEVLVSLQRAGQPVLAEAFNFAELRMNVDPGLQRTYVVGPGEIDEIVGVQPSVASHDERNPQGLPMMEPLPDKGLLFADIDALAGAHDPINFYMSAGDGCLTQPGFAGLAQTTGVGEGTFGFQGPLEVAPGDNLTLTLHEAKQGDDPFAVRCDTPSLSEPVPFSMAAGDRAHLIFYAVPGDPTIRSMILPFGE